MKLSTLIVAASCSLAACGGSTMPADDMPPGDDLPPGDDEPVDPPPNPSFRVTLEPQAGVTGTQRINFAVPIAKGTLTDANKLKVSIADGAELDAARRGLATWGDGSVRSVQVQVEVDVGAVTALDLVVGADAGGGTLELAPVADTLVAADGTAGPRVWARLPAEWLAASQVAGPISPTSAMAGTPLDAWTGVCDYAAWDVGEFLALDSDRGSWLYDRPTAMYRGYAETGSMTTLESAYREAAIYQAGVTGTGHSTQIGIATAESDVKYHYTQGMAIHYLLTGDDRFRETVENVGIRMHDLWEGPGYSGSGDFWTERNAGFSLLAYEWAAMVSDDRADQFVAWAQEDVDAVLPMMDNSANAWEPDARCFAHHADDHDEPYGYVGCSPWMSAILADGLDAYARRAGGDDATRARDALVKLGRMVARHGRDGDGRPYYWMGAGVDANEVDEYEEHWGESAYLVALAWYWSGRSDDELHTAAMELVNGLAARGEAGQLRSFNWQCRSAVATPYFLRD